MVNPVRNFAIVNEISISNKDVSINNFVTGDINGYF